MLLVKHVYLVSVDCIIVFIWFVCVALVLVSIVIQQTSLCKLNYVSPRLNFFSTIQCDVFFPSMLFPLFITPTAFLLPPRFTRIWCSIYGCPCCSFVPITVRLVLVFVVMSAEAALFICWWEKGQARYLLVWAGYLFALFLFVIEYICFAALFIFNLKKKQQ